MEKSVFFKIYKRQFFENNKEFTKFKFNMRFALKGGEVRHDAKSTIIYYYDGFWNNTEMNDAFHTKTFYGDDKVVLLGDEEITNVIGTYYKFKIESYFAEGEPKRTNIDTFWLRTLIFPPGEPVT